MKHILILAIGIFVISISGCKKEETCATYTKNTKVVKTDKDIEKI